jgi:hypothetical protein
MNTIMLALLWWFAGFGSFVYWWTSEEDLTSMAVIVGMFAGLLGPIAFVVGWAIHGKKRDFVIISRRK